MASDEEAQIFHFSFSISHFSFAIWPAAHHGTPIYPNRKRKMINEKWKKFSWIA
jgi:hypothetical protein